jgi:multidrug efflux pump subunit AcrA (membrane-fusion protein)
MANDMPGFPVHLIFAFSAQLQTYMNHPRSRRASWIRRLLLLTLVFLLAGVGIYVWMPRNKAVASIPTAEVKLGDFVDYVELRGEISVRSSKIITAPYNAGDLQILKLAPNGAHVNKGDVVVVFDPTTLQRSADQYRAALKQAEAEIARANAQRRLLDEQTQTDVMSAQFGLEKAQLDASTRDVVVQFDPSEQEYNLAQSKSQLEEAEQQIKKMKADQAVRVAQEQVSLLKAQFEVKRAELKVKGNDLLSGIEARKNVISLEEARRRLEQLQRDIKSRASSDAADLAMQNVARTRAMLGIKLAQQFIDNMTCRATISGIVVLGQNIEALMSASGGISISSDTEIPEYRLGAQAFAGRAIANIQEVDQMEIAAKVIETDRASIESGQSIDVIIDSRPTKVYKGIIKTLADSALSSENASTTLEYIEALSTRSFPAVFQVDTRGDPLNLGVTARVTIPGKEVRDALSLPRQALQQKEGKPVVYVRKAAGWEPRDVRVKYLTESRAVIEGLAEGTEVALVNPERQKSRAAGKTGPLTSVLGGAAQ